LKNFVNQIPRTKGITSITWLWRTTAFKNIVTARRYTVVLLKLEPSNRQALKLKELLDEQITKDGLVGIGIVGGLGVVAAAAAVGGFFLVKALTK